MSAAPNNDRSREAVTDGGHSIFIDCDGPEDTTRRPSRIPMDQLWPKDRPRPKPPAVDSQVLPRTASNNDRDRESVTDGGHSIFIDCDGPEDTTRRPSRVPIQQLWPKNGPLPPAPEASPKPEDTGSENSSQLAQPRLGPQISTTRLLPFHLRGKVIGESAPPLPEDRPRATRIILGREHAGVNAGPRVR